MRDIVYEAYNDKLKLLETRLTEIVEIIDHKPHLELLKIYNEFNSFLENHKGSDRLIPESLSIVDKLKIRQDKEIEFISKYPEEVISELIQERVELEYNINFLKGRLMGFR